MDKIYQVFVSSTFVDLQEERKEVMQALLELDCMPAGMELFPASNDDQWTLIKRVIDACDYYLLIIGGRYGSTNDQGISYTQMEFEYALSTGKPIVSFLHKNPGNIPASKSEQDAEKRQKLEAFRNLAQKKLVRYWETPAELGSTVSRSMIRLIKDFPAEGWVRAGSAVDESSIKEIARLQKENMDLQRQINDTRVSAPSGAENLQQGDDIVELTYDISCENHYEEITNAVGIMELTWNEIFGLVAPRLIDKCSEHELMNCFDSFAETNSHRYKNHKRLTSTYSVLTQHRIDATSFGIIIIQLKALGLIALTDKKSLAIDNRKTYWSLTPYGEYMATQLLALKR